MPLPELLPCEPYNGRLSLATCQARYARRFDRQPWEPAPRSCADVHRFRGSQLDTIRCRTCEAGARRAAGETEPTMDQTDRPTCAFFQCQRPSRKDPRPGRGWTKYCDEHGYAGSNIASEKARLAWEAAQQGAPAPVEPAPSTTSDRPAPLPSNPPRFVARPDELRARWERTEQELIATREERDEARKQLAEMAGARQKLIDLGKQLEQAHAEGRKVEAQRDVAERELLQVRKDRDKWLLAAGEAKAAPAPGDEVITLRCQLAHAQGRAEGMIEALRLQARP